MQSGLNKKIIIIAEIGVNHNGSLKIAKKLVDGAKKAGADIVKFQVYKTKFLVSKKTPLAKYQKKNTQKKIVDQFDLLKKYELSEKNIIFLINYCKKKKIEFMATPFDRESLKIIKNNVKRIKISSADIDNFELINSVRQLKKQIILSTGLSNFNEIKKTTNFLIKKGYKKNKIILLHCTSAYPVPVDEINLKSINFLKSKGFEVGFSDHTAGNDAAIAAVALGAKVIEKHITLNKKMSGPDHKASADINQFKELVKSIRTTEIALGNENKTIAFSAKNNFFIARRSLFSKKEIKKGEKFNSSNMICLRPAKGKSPTNWLKYLDKKKAKKNYKIGELI